MRTLTKEELLRRAEKNLPDGWVIKKSNMVPGKDKFELWIRADSKQRFDAKNFKNAFIVLTGYGIVIHVEYRHPG